MQNNYLGIDIGTTQIKAAIVDEKNNIIDIVCEKGNVYSPSEGWYEINMLEIWERLCKMTRLLTGRNKQEAENIRGVGITAVGEGLWPLDKYFQPVRNAILWNDTRSRNLEIDNKDDIDELLKNNSVTPLCTSSPPIVIKWLKENEPESYEKLEHGVHCADWLNYKLTGNLMTDETLASTSSINVKTKEYIPELFDLLQISDKFHTMPQIVKSTDIVGCITRQASNETGIKYGTPVIAGALDAAACALGAGVCQTGDACSVFGTSLCSVMMLDESQVDHTNINGSTLCYIIPGTYLRMMSTGNGSASIDWAKNLLAPGIYFDELERQISVVPIGSNGIIWHPYLNGERAPFKDPFACGGFYGLTARHTRFDMMRAAYEGLIFSLLDCYKQMPAVSERAFVAGGGASSDLLCGLMASAVNTTVYRSKMKQLGINGIVAAVKYGLGYSKNIKPFMDVEGTFVPNLNEHEKLEELYDKYVSLRGKVTDYWHTAIR